MKFSMLLVLVAFAPFTVLCSASAEDEKIEKDEIPWHKLKQAAERYLDTCVSKQDRKAMAKAMDARIEQRIQDTGASHEQAAREIMFDWAADNSGELERKDPEAVAQVCFYFVMFVKKGFAVSHQIRERLTPAICDEILTYLDDEIKNNVKHGVATNRPRVKGGHAASATP